MVKYDLFITYKGIAGPRENGGLYSRLPLLSGAIWLLSAYSHRETTAVLLYRGDTRSAARRQGPAGVLKDEVRGMATRRAFIVGICILKLTKQKSHSNKWFHSGNSWHEEEGKYNYYGVSVLTREPKIMIKIAISHVPR